MYEMIRELMNGRVRFMYVCMLTVSLVPPLCLVSLHRIVVRMHLQGRDDKLTEHRLWVFARRINWWPR